MAQPIVNKEQSNAKNIENSAIESTNIIQKTTESPLDEKPDSNNKESTINSSNVDDIYIKESSSNSGSIRKYLPVIFTFIGILLFIGIFSVIFALININSNKIVHGVSVNGIDLSGLTTEEATQKVTDEFSKKLNSPLSLNYADYKKELIPSQDVEANYNVSAAIEKAYSIGRSGNLIENNYEIFVSLIASKMVNVGLEYNDEMLNQYLDNISVELPGLVEQPSYFIENENLIITAGHSGIKLLEDETKELIIANIENLNSANSVNIITQNTEPDSIDITKIHDEIYSEPKNAYIIKEPFQLDAGSSGVDFAITIDEAQNLLQEKKEEYIIPLKLTPPEIGVEDLGNDIFVHKLGTFTSYYKVSNVNRSTNVELASKKINNTILLPGEVFSYNKVVGKRTFENGFREASIYTSAGVVDGLGGGICQVSSTLYNSVLLANLEIVERRNHSYAVSYVPLGRDATVSYGTIDFRFKNNRKYPIKVVSYSSNGVCTISIMGIKEDVEYDVSITTKRLQTIPFSTKYIDDSSMLVGTEQQTQYGDNGYKYETYKTLKLNGNVVSSEKISNDNYIPLTRIVRRGTRQPEQEVVAPPVVTPPSETPETPPEETPSTPPTTDSEDTSTGDNSGTTDSGHVDTNTPTPDPTTGNQNNEESITTPTT